MSVVSEHRDVVVRSWRTTPRGLVREETAARPPKQAAYVSDALVEPVLSTIMSGRTVIVDEFMDEPAAKARFGDRWRELAAKGGRVRWRVSDKGDWQLVHDLR